jgi:hypothetical protein
MQELTRYAGVLSGMGSQLSFSFYPPVSIEFGGAGEIRRVTSLQEATEFLMSDDWPGSGPPNARRRLTPCLAPCKAT